MSEIELKGKYASAKVFTENINTKTIGQVLQILNQSFAKDSHMRIMPDTHAAKGAVVGTTMRIQDKVVPNLVGADIGCGMLVVEIKTTDINFKKVDKVVKTYIPAGAHIRKQIHPYLKNTAYQKVIAPIQAEIVQLELGTMGGGNHFFEVEQSEDGRQFLVFHSGSRHLGNYVAAYYQDKAIQNLMAEGQHIPKELMYLEGLEMEKYLHDMKITQEYAAMNRAAMMEQVILHMGFQELGRFDTIHNYIDLEKQILRKGAISAKKGELVLIPMNMRDGSILARGKGNEDWNCSGPHGAGRLLSRSEAKESLSLDAYKETMKGIYSTTILKGTLDESPFAYKSMDEIVKNTKETIDIRMILKPIYNFKAAD